MAGSLAQIIAWEVNLCCMYLFLFVNVLIYDFLPCLKFGESNCLTFLCARILCKTRFCLFLGEKLGRGTFHGLISEVSQCMQLQSCSL